MDILVQLRKQDKSGKCKYRESVRVTMLLLIYPYFQVLHHLNFPSLDGIEEGYDQDVNIFKFLGS